jgi:hypothetical protein
MPKFELYYHKIPKLNASFFNDISNNSTVTEYNPYKISNYQNYNPLYNELFHLDENTYNRITLNQRYQFVDPNTVYDRVSDTNLEQNIFIKFSPLLDPMRYMVGKYKEQLPIIQNLPGIKDNVGTTHPKYIDTNNVSYTDNFFCYLCSQVLHMHSFANSLDYYGSFLCIQNKYKIDISDDIEYLQNSDYFNKHLNELFTVTLTNNPFLNFASRANKEPLRISMNNKHNVTCCSLPDLQVDSSENNSFDNAELNMVYENSNISKQDNCIDSDEESIGDSSQDSRVSYSSNDSELINENTNSSVHDGDTDSAGGDENWETDSDDESGHSSMCENETFAYINEYPVQGICIEKCKGTLDDLFENEQLSSSEGICALFQIIMTLLCYQKCFHFTHNDLHTNNIMYCDTDIEFLYYNYNGQLYKVPTYGKIYKIIDFGRSIYKFNGRLYCSDSFGPEGDADTQYNTEPFFNENKPRIDPNFSFDLCRLGCSLYDFIIDDDENPTDFNDLQKVIQLWCLDDNNKNILYKKNGEERYPDFKLYKMIARTVHNHTPEAQLKLLFFSQFETSNKKIGNINIMDIDKIPTYV